VWKYGLSDDSLHYLHLLYSSAFIRSLLIEYSRLGFSALQFSVFVFFQFASFLVRNLSSSHPVLSSRPSVIRLAVQCSRLDPCEVEKNMSILKFQHVLGNSVPSCFPSSLASFRLDEQPFFEIPKFRNVFIRKAFERA